jgi:hypothetical protein
MAPLARRDFVRHIRLTGLTEAVRSYVVSTPLLAGGSNNGSLVITKLVPAGSSVKIGDVLVEFDRRAQDKLALDKKAEMRRSRAAISRRTEQDAARVKESEVAQAENRSRPPSQVLKNEMLSRIKAETNDQNLAEARVKLAGLKDGFPLKRAAAAAGLRILEIGAIAPERDGSRLAERNGHDRPVTTRRSGCAEAHMARQWSADIQEGDEMWPELGAGARTVPDAGPGQGQSDGPQRREAGTSRHRSAGCISGPAAAGPYRDAWSNRPPGIILDARPGIHGGHHD